MNIVTLNMILDVNCLSTPHEFDVLLKKYMEFFSSRKHHSQHITQFTLRELSSSTFEGVLEDGPLGF